MPLRYEQAPSREKPASPLPGLLRRLILAWLVAATVETFVTGARLEGTEFLGQLSLVRLLGVMAAVFGALCLLRQEKLERWAMAAVFGVMAAACLNRNFTWPLAFACLLILGVLAVYGVYGWDGSRQRRFKAPKAPKEYLAMLAVITGIFFLAVSVWTVCRVLTHSTPTFDFGLFAQMFEHMRNTGLPTTTLERDGLLSHFAVHVSPIYYLMLPFYMLVPHPATLQVLQAAVLASAVIPLWKLSKRHGLSDRLSLLLCALLLFYPAYAGGTSYDLHENCFLVPLLLWLFYGLDTGKLWITVLSAVLTLAVKEDAAVYVAVVGLWAALDGLLSHRHNRMLTGAGLFLGAVVWFFLVTGYLAREGDGVMTYRYSNFMVGTDQSLLSVVKAVILSPMKAVYESVDQEKLLFLMQTMLPLLGLPLLTRRYQHYLLLIPYVLVNLMSDYQYQHSIFFQYTYGSTACLFYLTLVNLAEIPWKQLRGRLLGAALAVALVLFGALIVPKVQQYSQLYLDYQGYYSQVEQTLDTIPKEASVSTTTYYSTILYEHEVLYDIRYCTREHLLSTDYVAMSLSAESDCKGFGGVDGLIALLEQLGYEEYQRMGDVLVIYKAPE